MSAERDAIAALVTRLIAAGDRALADAKREAPAHVALDLRKIREAGDRLQQLLGERRGGIAPAAGARHELNNALNHLLGYSELLLEEPDAAAIADPLRAISTAARELRALLYEPAPPADEERGAAGEAAVGSAGTAPSGPAASILIVDDDPGNRDLLTRYLEARGHRALAMEHGRWALEMLEAVRVDVILLDLDMPTMNGYETLARLKADRRLEDIPVIVISATDSSDAVIRCLRLGAEDYLAKPVSPALFNARVAAAVLGRRRRAQQAQDLQDLARLAAAAAAIEAGTSAAASLDPVAARSDELGRLARVLRRLARPAGS